MPKLSDNALYNQYLAQLSGQQGMPKDTLASIMQIETSGGQDLTSPAGAVGPFQFMPSTAAQYGIDPHDPIEAAQGAAKYLGNAYRKHGGDLRKTAMEYHGGPSQKSWGPKTRSYGERFLDLIGLGAAEAAEPDAAKIVLDPESQKIFDKIYTDQVSPLATPGAPNPLDPLPKSGPRPGSEQAMEEEDFAKWTMDIVKQAEEDDARLVADRRTRQVDEKDSGQAIYTHDTGAGTAMLLRASFLKDPKARMRQYAKARGMDLKDYKLIDGVPSYKGEGGQWYAEEPTLSNIHRAGGEEPSMIGGDLESLALAGDVLASSAGPAIPGVAGALAGVASTPLLASGAPGLAGSAAAVGSAAGLGVEARDVAANALFPDEQQSSTWGDVLAEGGLQAGGQLVLGPAGTKLARMAGESLPEWARRMPRKKLESILTPENRAFARQADEAGVNLTPAEISGDPGLVAQQRAAGATERGGPIMAQHYEQVSEDVTRMADTMLDRIAPSVDSKITGQAAARVAGRAVKTAKTLRESQTRHYYERVLKDTNLVAPGAFNSLVNDPFMASQIAKVQGSNLLGLQALDPSSLPVLHEVRRNIAREARALASNPETANDARLMMGKHDALEAVLNREYPQYKLANMVYRSESKPVNELVDGAVGAVSQLTGEAARNAATMVLTADRISPEGARLAFRAIEKENAPLASVIKRGWLADRWDKAAPSAHAGVLNEGLKFRNLVYGDANQRKIIEMALNTTERKALADAVDVVSAASRVRPTGLDTRRMSMADISSRDLARAGGRLVGGGSKAEIVSWAFSFVHAFTKRGRLSTLAKAITAPGIPKQFAELKTIKAGTERWAHGVLQLARAVYSADKDEE